MVPAKNMSDRIPKPKTPWLSLAEHRIREAQAAGEFDNLPGFGKPIPGIDDSDGGLLATGDADASLLETPNDYDEGQTVTGGLDDGVENNFDEGQAGGGVPGNHDHHAGGEGMTP